MANFAAFRLRAKGKFNDLQELYEMLSYEHPENLCFYRVIEANLMGFEDAKDGFSILEVDGDCAHSAQISMLVDGHTSSEECKVTNIQEMSKRLNLKIQIKSIEFAECFEEHIYVDNGEILILEEEEFELYYDDDDVEHGEGPTMDIEWKF